MPVCWNINETQAPLGRVTSRNAGAQKRDEEGGGRGGGRGGAVGRRQVSSLTARVGRPRLQDGLFSAAIARACRMGWQSLRRTNASTILHCYFGRLPARLITIFIQYCAATSRGPERRG